MLHFTTEASISRRKIAPRRGKAKRREEKRVINGTVGIEGAPRATVTVRDSNQLEGSVLTN
jgi:hypothetical protein